jgi:hypothetical protein
MTFCLSSRLSDFLWLAIESVAAPNRLTRRRRTAHCREVACSVKSLFALSRLPKKSAFASGTPAELVM